MSDLQALREANACRQAEWDPSDKIMASYRGNELAGEVGVMKPAIDSANVVLFSRHKSFRSAVPIVTVERINDECRWPVEPGKKCGARRYGGCHAIADFIISTPGSEKAWLRCRRCLNDFLLAILPRPATEASEIERKEVERLQRQEARKYAEAAHKEHRLCEGYSNSSPFHLCTRDPIANCDGYHLGKRRCARHLAACKRNHKDLIRPISVRK